MNQNKTKLKDKLTVKNINKTFPIIIFVLVFIFTFLATSNELRQHWVILLSVFGGAVLLVGLTWLIMGLVIWKKAKNNDENQKKIKQALKKLKEEAIEERAKILDESNNSSI